MTVVFAAILAAAIGAYSTLAQVLLLREVLVVLAGNELSIAASLGSWLLGVGLGAIAGGKAARWRGSVDFWVFLPICLLVVIAPMAIVAVRNVHTFLDIVPGALVPPAETLALCLVLIAPASFGVGFSFAPLSRLAAREQDVGKSAAWIYALEAAGSVVSGAVFTFLLAGRSAPIVTIVTSGAIIAALASLIGVARQRRGIAIGAGSLSLVSLVLLLTGAAHGVERGSSDSRWRARGAVGTRIAAVDSRYQHLDLAENEGQFDIYANGEPLYSFPDPWERASVVHLTIAQLRTTSPRILLIGNGAADRVVAALAHEPQVVHYVTSDAAEIRLVTPHLSAADRQAASDPRTSVILDDGRRFVTRALTGSYDLIVVEAPDPTTARSNRLFTRDFLQECRAALAADGVLSIRISAAPTHLHDEMIAPAAAVYQSLNDVFGHVALWPGPQVRMFASASEGVVSDRHEVLAARWRERDPPFEIMSEQRFESAFEPHLVDELRDRLESAEIFVNRDSHPMAYLFGLVLWDERSRGATEPSPLWSLRVFSYWWVLMPLLLLAVWRAFGQRNHEKSVKRDGLLMVLTGGLCGLSLEVMLLFVFQNATGSLYSSLGALVALFMVGLTSGTVILRRALRDATLRETRKWSLAVEVSTVSAVLTTPLIAGTDNAWWLAGIWLVWSGFCTGAVFPPAVTLLANGASDSHAGIQAAGLADAADHFGACLGAITIGLFLLPVTGLLGSAVILAGVKVISIAGLIRQPA